MAAPAPAHGRMLRVAEVAGRHGCAAGDSARVVGRCAVARPAGACFWRETNSKEERKREERREKRKKDKSLLLDSSYFGVVLFSSSSIPSLFYLFISEGTLARPVSLS